MTDDFLITEPVHPCVCGHPVTAHGEEHDEYDGRWDWDDDHNDELYIEDEYIEHRPYCYECELECYFVEMDNLEYLEWKSNGNNKRS